MRTYLFIQWHEQIHHNTNMRALDSCVFFHPLFCYSFFFFPRSGHTSMSAPGQGPGCSPMTVAASPVTAEQAHPSSSDIPTGQSSGCSLFSLHSLLQIIDTSLNPTQVRSDALAAEAINLQSDQLLPISRSASRPLLSIPIISVSSLLLIPLSLSSPHFRRPQRPQSTSN